MPEIMRQDVGQLLWIGFSGPVSPALRGRLARGQAGAVVLFKRNLPIAVVDGPGGGEERCDLEALAALNADLHAAAPDGAPLLIAVDQEGGVVQRVRAPATRWPEMAAFDRFAPPEDTALAEQVGRAMGDELAALGFDIDFAPVLDVHTNPANPIIGGRAFGTEPEAVARRALAFARGLGAAGMIACGKHFPGHGDTTTDSHLELPRIDHDWDRLERVELLPFRRAAAAGVPLIMTAHVVFAALDPGRPATLSPQVMTGLLRERIGYRGVIVSDDLDMRAIADHTDAGGVGGAAVAAIRAGCDVLLLCKDEDHQAAAEAALIRQAEGDPAFRRRIGESAERVRALKRTHAQARAARPAPPLDAVGSEPHRRLAEHLAGAR
jgi:beta-N-acetylhexosaminidase